MPIELAERDGPNYTVDDPPMDMDMMECFQSYLSLLKMRLFWWMAQWVISLDLPRQNKTLPQRSDLASAQFAPLELLWEDDHNTAVNADRD